MTRTVLRVAAVVAAFIAGWVAGAAAFVVFCWCKSREHWGHIINHHPPYRGFLK